jgi:hypothetical protein
MNKKKYLSVLFIIFIKKIELSNNLLSYIYKIWMWYTKVLLLLELEVLFSNRFRQVNGGGEGTVQRQYDCCWSRLF